MFGLKQFVIVSVYTLFSIFIYIHFVNFAHLGSYKLYELGYIFKKSYLAISKIRFLLHTAPLTQFSRNFKKQTISLSSAWLKDFKCEC